MGVAWERVGGARWEGHGWTPPIECYRIQPSSDFYGRSDQLVSINRNLTNADQIVILFYYFIIISFLLSEIKSYTGP